MATWHALVGAALVFAAFLLVKMRPVSPRRKALAAEIRAARDRAHAAQSVAERAEALCEAGGAAAKQGRWTAAAGFFLRAMRTDPHSPTAIRAAVAALERSRPRLLEKMLWRRLAHVPWDEAHLPAVRAAVTGLAKLYGRSLRDTSRAEVMRRLGARLE